MIKVSTIAVTFNETASVKECLASSKKINPLKRQLIWNKSLRRYFKKYKSGLEQLILEPFMILSYLPALVKLILGKIKGVRFINSL